MALKFNLANQLISPEQMGQYGEAFGEGLGGMGLALTEAWDKQQKDQALGQEVDEFTADDDWTTGTRASDAEIEGMENEWLSQNPDWVKEDGEFKLYEDSQASKDLDAWAAGPEEGDYSASEIEQGRQKAAWNAAKASIDEGLAEQGALDYTTSAKIWKDSPEFTLDRKSLGEKIEIPEAVATQEDKDTYIKEHGMDAYNALTEKQLREQDSGMHSGASFKAGGVDSGFGLDREVSDVLEGTDEWKGDAQSFMSQNPQTSKFIPGKSSGMLGLGEGNISTLGSADQISSVSSFSPTISNRFKQDYSSMLSSMDEGQYFKMDKRTGEYSPTDRSRLDQINLLQQAARSGEMQDLMGGIPEGMNKEEYISKLQDAKRLPGDVGFKYNTAGESWLPEINQTSTSSPNDLDRLLWSKFSNFK